MALPMRSWTSSPYMRAVSKPRPPASIIQAVKLEGCEWTPPQLTYGMWTPGVISLVVGISRVVGTVSDANAQPATTARINICSAGPPSSDWTLDAVSAARAHRDACCTPQQESAVLARKLG